MLTYIIRRLVTALFIILAAAFLVYMLIAYSDDPLKDLRVNPSPNRDSLIRQRIELLDLNTPPPLRFFKWLGGAAGCITPFLTQCTLGSSIQGQQVTQALGTAVGNTLQLVVVATLLSIVIGVTMGIITALRQYSALDYTATFITFLCFSLPSFWLAVLLKEYGAIGFNQFLSNGKIPLPALLIIGAITGIVWALFATGKPLRRLIFGVIGFAVGLLVFLYLDLTDWFQKPNLGPILIAIFGAGIATLVTILVTGLKNKRAWYTGLIQVVLGLVAYYVLNPTVFNTATWTTLLVLALIAIAVGLLTGFLMAGQDRGQSMRVGAFTALLMGGLVVLDRFMITWPQYVSTPRVRGPIATVGAETPGLDGDFWITGLDKYTHLVLPTITLLLVGMATYTRYARSSTLETMNQDYIRTARSKGLSERTVVMRHAFRNMLIPLTTILALDFGAVIGGAAITENVFAFQGMGQLFVQALNRFDPNIMMGVFLVTGVAALVMNLIADLTYSALDPRVRVKS